MVAYIRRQRQSDSLEVLPIDIHLVPWWFCSTCLFWRLIGLTVVPLTDGKTMATAEVVLQ